jgi:hypothetical protein
MTATMPIVHFITGRLTRQWKDQYANPRGGRKYMAVNRTLDHRAPKAPSISKDQSLMPIRKRKIANIASDKRKTEKENIHFM